MSFHTPGLLAIFIRFDDLRQAPIGDGKRMPHKPLLILLMLGRAQRGKLSPIPFTAIRVELEELLTRFGPPSPPNARDPFWRLQNDPGQIWIVRDNRGGRVAETTSPPTIRQLEDSGAMGSFTPDLCEAFFSQPGYAATLGARILANNFPASLHDDIAASVGLSLENEKIPEADEPASTSRDPGFRSRILTAYEYRCAITGWDLRVGDVSTGIEAAHIRWHVAGGPSDERNGIALNALHHKLFDLGAFTLSDDDEIPRIHVSRKAHGGGTVTDFLMRFHMKPIRPPQDPEWLPDHDFIRWHRREVFKGPHRTG